MPGIDASVPHPARRYNYWLGGKDHFAIDRSAGDKLLTILPELAASARASRAFLGRAVRFLTAEVGLRQFLDIGPGLPTANSTHEVAQAVAPESRIVWPTTSARPPKCACHTAWLMTATRWPGASSRSVKTRPRAGGTPSTVNRLALARTP